MNKIMGVFILVFMVGAAPRTWCQAPRSQEQPCPMHGSLERSESHRAMVESHSDHAMGFPHDKTAHHFRLTENGGSIDVTANDSKDSVNIDAIRMHLAHITKAFSEGDYSAPMLVHGTTPPGVTTMMLLNGKIRFQYLAVDGGARVSIATEDAIGRAAIHDFLRFQITDHETGDSMDLDAGR